ncbi:MAG: asparagine synthase (glutamine-hydrolyzing) [Alphaproteobacteria bacterium]|nr:asparagine synthase (glutamine-hydrolyzing) [Alphaproteobacteria bacterium]
MCGIAGLINVEGATIADVQAMVSVVRHRGPDDAGVVQHGAAVMGHARLAIVDPATGRQPLYNEDGSVCVTFNGCIYNYVELRAELEAKGYHFKTRCDTEVLVHLWRAEGENMMRRMIGMFAFFIWDTKQQRGMLVRDRQGIKPCFVARYQGGYAFASEMKSILALPGMKRELNASALKEVFAFNYCLSPHTCFTGIEHVEPGCYWLFEGKKEPQKKRYWQWPLEEEKRTPSFEEFEALLEDAVRLQMRFDVAGGLYLSGGVDSSVVGYHVRRAWREKNLDAYGLNTVNEAYSEFGFSEQAADQLDIHLHEVRIEPKLLPEIASKVIRHAEQPHGDFSFFLFYLLAERAHRDGKVVLFSGDGPDEALGGQHFRRAPRPDFSLKDYFATINYMDSHHRACVLNPDFEHETPDPWARFQEKLAPFGHMSLIDQIVAFETTSLLPGNNLLKGERMGAAWSTEVRSPLMDHRISELFVCLPSSQKFADGYSKFYFKNYAATKFPREFIFREKTMPTMPIGEWIKAPLYDWAHELLARHDGSIMNTKAALAMLAEHKEGKANHTKHLRTMLMTQLWLEHVGCPA